MNECINKSSVWLWPWWTAKNKFSDAACYVMEKELMFLLLMIQKIHSNIHDSERLTKSQRDCLWSLRLKGEEQCPGLWNLFCFVSVLTHNDQIYSKDICHKNQYIMCQRILIHNFSNLCVWDLGSNHFERQLLFPFCSPPSPCLQPTPPLSAACILASLCSSHPHFHLQMACSTLKMLIFFLQGRSSCAWNLGQWQVILTASYCFSLLWRSGLHFKIMEFCLDKTCIIISQLYRSLKTWLALDFWI